ncbi:hypothetical protein XO10_03620 [Marinitoga sp. 1135]|uniref:Flagellar biogenesis protein n=1 Tax=Marinitoga piezophila (strain DSM 14283 / JCM 11233 / KA3) TaxID=443254 RepID=H2J6G7_MARPK|nr:MULTISPECIES: hypothetical protein [Marinitoga]AEX85152.1 hypothetical protein Marpi_0718 [Marinitoga piezophila KA3]APT75651.1 hypothetical protein LN42_04040 [Marinitoga sp. 1137]NUU95391.1 hypothetical protein [Marinitoga sp. 1135]
MIKTPLTFSSTATTTTNLTNWTIWAFLLLFFFVIFIFLLIFIQKKLINKGVITTPKVRVVKKFYIDHNMTLNIIKVLDDYYLVLSNHNSIAYLDKIDYEKLSEILKGKRDFLDSFVGALKREKKENEKTSF